MPKIGDLLRERRTLSLEFPPPRDDYAAQQTRKALTKLEALQPDFASVTYGAGGSTRDATRELVEVILSGRYSVRSDSASQLMPRALAAATPAAVSPKFV